MDVDSATRSKTVESHADAAQLTQDGRYIIVKGRRWRASDPSIPTSLANELIHELMAARRTVRTKSEQGRPRVQAAKLALGERGYPWWETPSESDLTKRITAAIIALLNHRDGKSICPSDAARVVGGNNWRNRLDLVRDVAWAMETEGKVIITQKGSRVDQQARGPIRIYLTKHGPRQ